MILAYIGDWCASPILIAFSVFMAFRARHYNRESKRVLELGQAWSAKLDQAQRYLAAQDAYSDALYQLHFAILDFTDEPMLRSPAVAAAASEAALTWARMHAQHLAAHSLDTPADATLPRGNAGAG